MSNAVSQTNGQTLQQPQSLSEIAANRFRNALVASYGAPQPPTAQMLAEPFKRLPQSIYDRHLQAPGFAPQVLAAAVQAMPACGAGAILPALAMFPPTPAQAQNYLNVLGNAFPPASVAETPGYIYSHSNGGGSVHPTYDVGGIEVTAGPYGTLRTEVPGYFEFPESNIRAPGEIKMHGYRPLPGRHGSYDAYGNLTQAMRQDIAGHLRAAATAAADHLLSGRRIPWASYVTRRRDPYSRVWQKSS